MAAESLTFDDTMANVVPLDYCNIVGDTEAEQASEANTSSLSESGLFATAFAVGADLYVSNASHGVSWFELVKQAENPEVTDFVRPHRRYPVNVKYRFTGAGKFDGQP